MTTKPRPGLTIFQAQRTAQKLLTKADTGRLPVLMMPREELRALAQQLADVSAIAADLHLERRGVGSLAPEAFPPPVEG